MISLIRGEVKKNLYQKTVIILWILSLALASILLQDGSLEDIYADVFYKTYAYSPFIGLVLFSSLSGSYTREYDSQMNGLINTTVRGREKFVLAKALGAWLVASIINLTIVGLIFLEGLVKTGFKGLDIALKDLWYFQAIGVDLKVWQTLIVFLLSLLVLSFFLAQLALYLSSLSRSASISFIFGGLLMGLAYLLDAFLPKTLLALSPVWTMMSFQLVKYDMGLARIFLQLFIYFLLGLGLIVLTYREFTKEDKID